MIGRSRATEWCKFERVVVSIKDAGSIFKKKWCVFFCFFVKIDFVCSTRAGSSVRGVAVVFLVPL
jgi:fructose-1-phosphate kinase PfkB-like protein